jgi:hypothetical protein
LCHDEQVNQRSRERVRDDLVRLAGARLPLASLIDEAGRLIARAVPYDGACWHTVDPATLIDTSFRAVNLPSQGTRLARNEYLDDDYNRWVELARSRRHSRVLSEATAGDLNRSPRYREFLRPAGFLGELRTSFVADGACWGWSRSSARLRTTLVARNETSPMSWRQRWDAASAPRCCRPEVPQPRRRLGRA